MIKTRKGEGKKFQSLQSPKRQSRNSGQAPRNGAQKKKVKTLDPELFVKEASKPKEIKTYTPTRSISELPIHPQIKERLLKKGFTQPTEIQDRSIDVLLKGRNVLGIAQTGTGKTGAFLIPLIHQLLNSKPDFQVLIIVPTRELAVQVEAEFKSITKDLKLYCSCFIGGVNINRDLSALRRKSHVVIGTPGRLNDLGRQRALDFSDFKTLILDEFDRLLDMGFIKEIQKMVQAMHQREQTLLFSATEDKAQMRLIGDLLEDPFEIRVSNGQTTGDHINQSIVKVAPHENKFEVLVNLLQDEAFQKVLVFAETKRSIMGLYKKLVKLGMAVEQIHGNKSQGYRLKALRQFKEGQVKILLATDVAARGLDITEVSHVINYQAPSSMDAYIHRIGRTGRAGHSGEALTFIQ